MLFHSIRRVLLAASVLLIHAGVPAAGLAAEQVRLVDPYARAVPPGQPNSALFLTLENAGGEDRALVSVQSPVAERVELHNHIDDGGIMRMRRVSRIDIPAGGSAVLKPGGYHVMLIGLERQLKSGEEIPVELRFDDGSGLAVTVPVRGIMEMMGHDHHHHHGAGGE